MPRSATKRARVRFALAIAIPLAAALLRDRLVPFMSIAGARPTSRCSRPPRGRSPPERAKRSGGPSSAGSAADLLSAVRRAALALASLLPVAAIGLGESLLRPRSVLSGAVLVGVATLVAGLLYLLILLAVGHPLSDPVLLAGGAAAGAIYNGVLAIATYPIARWVHHLGAKQASFGL